MKFKEGQKFAYTAGGNYTYHCVVTGLNDFGSPVCEVTAQHNAKGTLSKPSVRTLKKSSFSDGTREIVDIRDQPLTKEQEYESLWV